jgi:acetyl-CoA carboxylase biotin carboxyl carrier protein
MAVKPKEERVPARRNPPSGAGSEIDASVSIRFSLAEVRQLVALMHTSDLNEITIERPSDGMRLALRKTVEILSSGAPLPVAAAVIPAVVPATATAPTANAPEPEYITAPLVGTFYAALKAGQKPLVKVGDSVREGQIIGGIETLRVMNEVEAHMDGRVVEILVQPGQPVEYGQRLIALAPETH